jgi:allantoinase
VFAPDETFVLRPDMLRQRHPLTPYLGQRLRGVVRQTWLAGAPIEPGQRRGQLVTAGTADG